LGLENCLSRNDRFVAHGRSAADGSTQKQKAEEGEVGMTTLLARVRIVVGALTLLGFAVFSHLVAAQQPTSVDPAGSAVHEEQLLQQFKTIQGRGSIPDVKSYTIEQPAGRDWRHFHEVTLRWIGAVAIVGILAVLVIFYLTRGMVRIESGRSGHKIVRFGAYERFVHWMTATCFIILALSGLNITFGRPLLLPLMSPEAFTAWSEWAKYAHNYLSFPFTLGVILIFFMWIAGNIPNRVDVEWFKRGGGMVGHDHPPAERFNGGQKAIYWIVVLGGTAAAVSGYTLIFPFYGTDIETMQSATMVHSIIAMLFIAAMLGHIYIGTIGMEGAFEAMGEGTVDINWAKEHHALWLEQERARTGPAQSQRQPAATPGE
jgi:formate dehydrogenase subunit gamma